MTQPSKRLPTAFAHILFVDIVGFSRRSMNQQAAYISQLRRVVEASPEFQSARAANGLLCLDRGDGMALVFFHDPVSPVQCAIEVAQALGTDSSLSVRMGVHTGAITRTTDITEKENVYGAGINMAQRVMDCGEAGHLLLSSDTARVLLQLDGANCCTTWESSWSNMTSACICLTIMMARSAIQPYHSVVLLRLRLPCLPRR